MINDQSNNFSNLNVLTLKDIRDVTIDKTLPVTQRIEKYIEQIKNPYIYKCGDIIVKTKFSNNEDSLEKHLVDFFVHYNDLM